MSKNPGSPSSLPERILQFLLAAGAGAAVWVWTAKLPFALAMIVGAFLGLEWFRLLLQWHESLGWFNRIQRFLIQSGSLPPEFRVIRKMAPWKVEAEMTAVLTQATDRTKALIQENHTQRKALDSYLGQKASAHAAQGSSMLAGSLKRVFVLFSDLRGFTSMSEKLTPAETVQVLNVIYTGLEAVLAQGGGEINKYIGDAILAYFKRPDIGEEGVAERVAKTTQAMQARFQEILDRQALLKSKGVTLGLGIGVVAGEAILGDVGSRNRREFTLIGDSVNLASRLCSVSPAGEVLMDEKMARLVSQRYFVESRPPVQLKGKAEKVTPYCLMNELAVKA